MQYERYLTNFDSDSIRASYSDVIVIGSGPVGLFAALGYDSKYKVTVLTKEVIPSGIKRDQMDSGVVYINPVSNNDTYIRDTLYSGAGLCDEDTVKTLVANTPSAIKKIEKFGVTINQAEVMPKERSFHRDETEKTVKKALMKAAVNAKNIDIVSNIFVIDLLVDNGKCYGVLVYDEKEKVQRIYYGTVTICAAGGYGSIFKNTVKPDANTGDGVALAFRAGAEVKDLEFIKFHPTVLYTENNKNLIISETLRKEGGVLVTKDHRRFMHDYHELADRANPDAVARAITKELQKTGDECVYLDIRHKDKSYMLTVFPDAYNECLKYGINMQTDLIPVVPAEQYCMGGIKTDINGETSIKNFFACGEAACNGVHGANRLARNTLIDGIVFADKICEASTPILETTKKTRPKFSFKCKRDKARCQEDVIADIELLKQTMTDYVGTVRSAEGLFQAMKIIMDIRDRQTTCANETIYDYILQNDIMLAEVIIISAIERRETRGPHYRSDFPRQDDRRWRKSITRKFY